MFQQKLYLTAIVAVAHHNAVGKNNELPWSMPNDLIFFKNKTWGNAVIMGSNTYLSIQKDGKPLPGRKHIVVTNSLRDVPTDVTTISSLEGAFFYCQEIYQCKRAFIVGGGQLYASAMPFVDELFLTRVDISIPNADVFFPELEYGKWNLLTEKTFSKDKRHSYNYRMQHYQRLG